MKWLGSILAGIALIAIAVVFHDSQSAIPDQFSEILKIEKSTEGAAENLSEVTGMARFELPRAEAVAEIDVESSSCDYATVHGQAKDSLSRALSGLKVLASTWPNHQPLEMRAGILTDDSGEYFFHLPPGKYELSLGDQLGWCKLELKPNQNIRQDFVVDDLLTEIPLIVLNSDNSPIPEKDWPELKRRDPDIDDLLYSYDPEGIRDNRLLFSLLADGPYLLKTDSDRFRIVHPEIEIQNGRVTYPVSLIENPQVTWKILLNDAPFSGALSFLRDQDQMHHYAKCEGSAAFFEIPGSHHYSEIKISDGEFTQTIEDRDLVVLDGQPAEIVLELNSDQPLPHRDTFEVSKLELGRFIKDKQLSRLEVRVLDSNAQPIQGIQATLDSEFEFYWSPWKWHLFTDSAGKVAFTVPEGNYSLFLGDLHAFQPPARCARKLRAKIGPNQLLRKTILIPVGVSEIPYRIIDSEKTSLAESEWPVLLRNESEFHAIGLGKSGLMFSSLDDGEYQIVRERIPYDEEHVFRILNESITIANGIAKSEIVFQERAQLKICVTLRGKPYVGTIWLPFSGCVPDSHETDATGCLTLSRDEENDPDWGLCLKDDKEVSDQWIARPLYIPQIGRVEVSIEIP